MYATMNNELFEETKMKKKNDAFENNSTKMKTEVSESRVETTYPENSKKQKAKTNGTFRIQAAFYGLVTVC
jgi:hypothetical protein